MRKSETGEHSIWPYRELRHKQTTRSLQLPSQSMSWITWKPTSKITSLRSNNPPIKRYYLFNEPRPTLKLIEVNSRSPPDCTPTLKMRFRSNNILKISYPKHRTWRTLGSTRNYSKRVKPLTSMDYYERYPNQLNWRTARPSIWWH